MRGEIARAIASPRTRSSTARSDPRYGANGRPFATRSPIATLIPNPSADCPSSATSFAARRQTPAVPFGIGGTRVRLSVTDTHGASSFCDGTVTVLRYGLRAAYGFEETPGTGVALDATPFHNDGSVNGPARIAGRFGQGMRFDGVDDIINVADSDSLDLTRSMTLMAWVRPDADSGWRTILLKERQNGLAYALYANDSIGDGTPAGYVRLGFADREIAAPDAPATGQWMHVAMTFGGGQIRIYVNGMLARSDYAYGSAKTTGTGFPKVFYLTYHLYRDSFPLLALASYLKTR